MGCCSKRACTRRGPGEKEFEEVKSWLVKGYARKGGKYATEGLASRPEGGNDCQSPKRKRPALKGSSKREKKKTSYIQLGKLGGVSICLEKGALGM